MSLDPWTLLLQTANVLVLVWLLQRFLFRPVTEAVARRQQLVLRRLDEARQAQDKAEALRQSLATEQAAQADLREKILAEARSTARAEREAILARTAAEVDARLAGSESQLADQRRQWQSKIEAEAGELAIGIARRLLDRFPREVLTAAFLEDGCRTASALPPEQRRIVEEDVRGSPVRVVAAAWSDEMRSSCRERMARLFGGAVDVEFEEQPALLAGIELHFRRLVIRNSWSNDLENLKRQLADDGRIRATA